MSNQPLPKYSDIEGLHKVPDLLIVKRVVVKEKIHGTNVRFGIVNGEFFMGGRNMLLPQAHIMGFEDKAVELASKLKAHNIDNMAFYGEWYGPGIQKHINYGNEKRFVIFDVADIIDGQKRFKEWNEVVDICSKLKLPTVPLLYMGPPSMDIFDKLLACTSKLAMSLDVKDEDNIQEGIVIVADPIIINAFGERLIAKYKNQKFAETKSGTPRKPKVLSDDVKEFVEEFVTQQRVEHVLSQLREGGHDIEQMSIMKHLIPAMIKDLQKEAADEITALGENSSQLGKLVPSKLRELMYKILMESVL